VAVVQSTGKLQRSSVTGAQTFTNAFAANTTPGNTAIVTIVHYGSGVPNTRITGVTVGGTAGVKDVEKLDSGNINAVEIWRVSNMASASRDVVITLPGASGQFVTAGVEEWDNITTSSPLDQTGTGGPTAGSTAPSVTSAGSTTQATEIVYAAFCDYVGSNWTSSTPPAGYTEAWEEPAGASVEAGSAAYQSISATGTQTATFTTGASMSWIAVMATYKQTGGGSTPTVTTTSTATPAQNGSLTITGTNFGASQGTGSVTIGGAAQTVTAWADTSITITVSRGASKYGTSVNLVVTNNSSLSSSPYALTGLVPQSGWAYVDVGTPNATAANRITTVPDLASGDQVAYQTQGGQVVVANDGTFSVSTGVRSFDFEVWTSPDGWGAAATQYVRIDVADTRLKKQRMRSGVMRWMWSGAAGEKFSQRGWFSRDIVLPIAAGGGSATVNGQTLTSAASLIAGSAQASSSVSGQTLTSTASLITGAASASVTVSGQTLTATASLIPGTATGDSQVSGQTLTSTASLIPGSASAGASATVNGQTLTSAASLIAASAQADAIVSGQTLTTIASFLAGSATASGSVPAQILVATASLIPGAASGVANATVNGQLLSVVASLIAGSASSGGGGSGPAGPARRRGWSPRKVIPNN
jgi:hypothetical protein